jgi:hypothetical protein
LIKATTSSATDIQTFLPYGLDLIDARPAQLRHIRTFRQLHSTTIANRAARAHLVKYEQLLRSLSMGKIACSTSPVLERYFAAL